MCGSHYRAGVDEGFRDLFQSRVNFLAKDVTPDMSRFNPTPWHHRRPKNVTGTWWNKPGPWPEGDNATTGSCLIYGFGISREWFYDDAMAALGCEVHSFDPTTHQRKSHERHGDRIKQSPRGPLKVPPVFHYGGLSGGDALGPGRQASFERKIRTRAAKAERARAGQGFLGGPLKTLHAWREELQHTGRPIAALKIDCEGCEWEAFAQMARAAEHNNGRSALDGVAVLLIELHFGALGGVPSPPLVEVEGFFHFVLRKSGFRLWFLNARRSFAEHSS